MKFKKSFIERYSKLTDFDKFSTFSLTRLNKSIRINTLKIPIAKLKTRLQKQQFKLEPIPWCNQGFWITGPRTDIGNLLEHELGYIYVQEAASMIPPIVLSPKPGETILDMCASPGSKTTQIAQYMNNTGTLVANDLSKARLQALKINLQRLGIINTIITRMHGKYIKIKFDKVLVDAPCSGIGTIRKSPKTLKIYNPNMSKKLAGVQKRLIDTGFNALKKNGILVYSTCTLEPEENEAVIDFLLNKHKDAKLMEINLKIKRSPPVQEFNKKKFHKDIKKCLRIWPQDNDTEGFFVAKIKKI